MCCNCLCSLRRCPDQATSAPQMQTQTQPLDSLQLALFSGQRQNKVGSAACKRMDIFALFNRVHFHSQVQSSRTACQPRRFGLLTIVACLPHLNATARHNLGDLSIIQHHPHAPSQPFLQGAHRPWRLPAGASAKVPFLPHSAALADARTISAK